MSKETIIQKLLDENVDPSVKYHSLLPGDISPWYVYTRSSGHRVLCVLKKSLSENMTEADYRDRLVSAPVKTVLRGYSARDGFVIVDAEYGDSGFATEKEDVEFEPAGMNVKHSLVVGQPYLQGTDTWPEAVEYNYFSCSHELRFFLANPTRYITEVIGKMPVQLGLFTQDDIILLVYKFTDYKKHMIPVHGYSPFSIHLVPENMRTIPALSPDPDHEEVLMIHLVDAATGILRAARRILLSPGFSAALCSSIARQAANPMPDDYSGLLQKIDGMYVDTESLLNNCIEKCTG